MKTLEEQRDENKACIKQLGVHKRERKKKKQFVRNTDREDAEHILEKYKYGGEVKEKGLGRQQVQKNGGRGKMVKKHSKC